MNLASIKRRLDALEKRRKQNTCTCPPKERYDFNLLSAEERARLIGIAERFEPEDPDPCPVCGSGRAPCNFDDIKDSELRDASDLLQRATVENGPHVWEDLWTMTEQPEET